MNTTGRRLLYWTPRVLTILLAIFLGLLALDVFDEGRGFGETALALLIHLLPTTFLVLVVLVIGWRREWIGGVLYSLFAVFYLVWAWGKVHWTAFATISGPLLMIGILFLLNWRFRSQLRES